MVDDRSICLVYKEDYPWDVRVEKLANSFVKAGYHVHLVCQNIQCRDRIEIADSITIHRMPHFSPRFKSINKLVNFPLWFNPVWILLIYQVTKRYMCQAIVVRDLPLVLSGVVAAKLLSRALIFDMAECYPEMYRSLALHEKRGFLTRIIKSPVIAEFTEKVSCHFSDLILVMIEESMDRLVLLGIEPEKIAIVSNTPLAIPKQEINHQNEQLNIVYVGFVTRLRGLDILINAVKRFISSPDGGEGIFVDIIGKGSAIEELNHLIVKEGLSDRIKIHGWLEQSDIDSILSRANVGALTYRVCPHWNHTIPNKIFDYMHEGLPIISTNVIPIERILTDESAGLSGEETDTARLAEILIRFKAPSFRQKLGENGRNAILNNFNWAKDEQRLLWSLEQAIAKNRAI